MKRKSLLLAILMIVGAWGQLYAQKDVTSQYITNATLANGTNGWTKTFTKTIQTNDPADAFSNSVRGNNTTGYASEAYAGWGSLIQTAYSIKQEITLPKGNYTLVSYSFFRQGEGYNTNPEKSLAFLKAGNSQVPLKTLGSITAASYANSQAEGANVFDSKMYRNTIDFTIDADGTTIEIGVEGTFDEMRSWCIVGQFELINNDLLATMDAPFDVTGYITNPGFEYRDMTGWTLEPEGIFGTQSNNQPFKVGGFYAEKWQASGALPEGKMSQTLTNLPAGLYQLTANLGGDGTYVDLNGKTANWTADGNYTVSYVLSAGENLTISAGKTAEGTANWVHFDNFKLAFCGNVAAALSALCAEVTKYQDKLPAEAYSALVAAVNAKNKTYTDPNELLAAIDAVTALFNDADVLAAAYTAYNEALTEAKAVNATSGLENIVNRNLLIALQTAINTPVSEQTADAYNAAAEALNAAAAAVKATVNAISSGVIPTDVLDGWAISTTNGELRVNTWSVEGNTDGSGMLTPFVQDWVGAGTALSGGNEGGMLYYTFNGLIPGKRYTISALVRVFNEAATGVTGASFFVGDELKSIDDYAAPCAGDFANKGKFATFSATGEVDADGVLKFGVLLNSDSPINWIAIKNATIQEASGILPTAITLNPKTLKLVTGEAGTIEATVAPENAEDKTLVWTSSNEKVAVVSNGIVNAVGPGTAVITATSVAKETVKATANVTVTDAPDIANKSEFTGEGGYLIRNVATGKYLNAANTWGTQASICKHGVIAQVVASGSAYKIIDICNATSGLGDNCYADNPSPADLTIAPVAGKQKVYTIAFDGKVLSAQAGTTALAYLDNANSTLAQWEFIDEADRIANLKAATEANPADATWLIMDPNFSRNNGYYDNWTLEVSNHKNHAGDNTNLCVESYHSTFNLEQTIDLPNGTYRVTAQGFYRNDNNTESADPGRPVFFANDKTAAFPERTGTENSMSDASLSFLKGNYTIEPFTVEVTDHVLKIGAKNETNLELWCIWDNFELELIKYSASDAVMTDDDTKAPAQGEYNAITYDRTLLAGLNTIVLPFATTKDELGVDAVLQYDGSEVNGSQLRLLFSEVENLEPNTPYAVFVKADTKLPKFLNKLVSKPTDLTVADDSFSFVGSYCAYPMDASPVVAGDYIAGTDGFKKANGGNEHKAYRAFMQNEIETPEPPIDEPLFVLGNLVIDGIANVGMDNANNNNGIYNLNGQQVTRAQRGIYIINGKKVVIK